jgi:hypothetical protein
VVKHRLLGVADKAAFEAVAALLARRMDEAGPAE